jgi:hypothetical protein
MRNIEELPRFELFPKDAQERSEFSEYFKITPEEHRLIAKDYFKRNPIDLEAESKIYEKEEENEEESLKKSLAKYGMVLNDIFLDSQRNIPTRTMDFLPRFEDLPEKPHDKERFLIFFKISKQEQVVIWNDYLTRLTQN